MVFYPGLSYLDLSILTLLCYTRIIYSTESTSNMYTINYQHETEAIRNILSKLLFIAFTCPIIITYLSTDNILEWILKFKYRSLKRHDQNFLKTCRHNRLKCLYVINSQYLYLCYCYIISIARLYFSYSLKYIIK